MRTVSALSVSAPATGTRSMKPRPTCESADYYLTDRGGHPNAENRFVVTSVGLHMAYFPFAQIETISPRPLLLIAGENAETLTFSQNALRT